jgi:hypothetical protein
MRRCGTKEVNAAGRPQNRAVVRTLILPVLILVVACDSGMSVRQVNSVVEPESADVTAFPQISIDVNTTQLLIGQRLYDPRVTATNLSDIPVTITSIELLAGSRTLQNGLYAKRDYPVNLPAHSTVPLGVYFRVSDGAAKTFNNPAELRVHYSSPQGSGFARITLARGPLNSKRR